VSASFSFIRPTESQGIQDTEMREVALMSTKIMPKRQCDPPTLSAPTLSERTTLSGGPSSTFYALSLWVQHHPSCMQLLRAASHKAPVSLTSTAPSTPIPHCMQSPHWITASCKRRRAPTVEGTQLAAHSGKPAGASQQEDPHLPLASVHYSLPAVLGARLPAMHVLLLSPTSHA